LSGFIGSGTEERCIAKKQLWAELPAPAKSWGEECWEKGEDSLAERGEGMVDLPTAVTFANQSGEGQTAGMLADGG
jgi:hypothetical protein